MEDKVKVLFRSEIEAIKPELKKVEEAMRNVWVQIAKDYARDLINPESLRKSSYSYDVVHAERILSKEGFEAFKNRLKASGFKWDLSSGCWAIDRALIDGELNDNPSPTLNLTQKNN